MKKKITIATLALIGSLAGLYAASQVDNQTPVSYGEEAKGDKGCDGGGCKGKDK